MRFEQKLALVSIDQQRLSERPVSAAAASAKKGSTMPKFHKKPANRFFRRGNRVRKLGLESLESRVCPAVTFGFEEGVLKITGNDQRNEIEIFQPADKVVDIKAD